VLRVWRQCKLVSEKLGVVHISAGDVLREAAAQGTPMGVRAKECMDRGELVPTEVRAKPVSAGGTSLRHSTHNAAPLHLSWLTAGCQAAHGLFGTSHQLPKTLTAPLVSFTPPCAMQVAVTLVKERLEMPDCAKGWMLDG
jgi:hypothetical protein